MPHKTAPRDYRETLLLPKTSFPMQGKLPHREPEILKGWAQEDLYQQLRQARAGCEKFILHDGPPYANGHIHMGHALNKILKDIVVRSHQMTGRDATYVPGWDCHGLPIEWKVEEAFRKQGRAKESVPASEFREACRGFAQKWIQVQKEEFKRLGIMGHWQAPYTTMEPTIEAATVGEFLKFAMSGAVYRGTHPVMWSTVEKTALAEAEVEYHEHLSSTVLVAFPLNDEVSALIWTTTPWTLPGNRAIAYGPHLSYGLYETQDKRRFLLAHSLAEKTFRMAQVETWRCVKDISPEGLVAHHPLRGKGYEFDVPLLPGDFVTEEAGTGLVHIAPGHGQDDFLLGQKHNLPVPLTVDDEGVYGPQVPLFSGRRILTPEGKTADADEAVIAALRDVGALVGHGKLRHAYPHSWRSGAPLIFRAVPQWFISMQTHKLREKALAAIDKVVWYPASAQRRIRAMVADRPDWVISRQRLWGVPLTLFVHGQTGEILKDEAVNARIVAAVRERGAHAWYTTPIQDFLGDAYDPQDWEKVEDTLDVWFDSGATHASVLRTRADLKWPASLYLEGSDQHRGWFQSSLLAACGTQGQAPYEAVVTHGFVLDDKGRKMSKSLGNVITPHTIVDRYGADILRLWCASADTREDIRLGEESLKSTVEAYRKLRNGLRFLLGNLHGWTREEKVETFPSLERLILHKLQVCDETIRAAYERFDPKTVMQTVFHLVSVDLSAFYFDIRKDSLYCDAHDSPRRRACRTTLDILFSCLSAWLAPILCFTTEEAWSAREGARGDGESVHLRSFPQVPPEWRDEALAHTWEHLRRIRRVMTSALEVARQEDLIGSSLEAAATVYITDPALAQAARDADLAEIAITSQAHLLEEAPQGPFFTLPDVPQVHVKITRAQGRKCQRSWKILKEVGANPTYPDLSPRDADVVAKYDAAAP